MRSDEPAVVGIDTCTNQCVHPQTVRHVQARALSEPDLSRVAAIFKLVGDPTRARLLYALLEAGELCVCDLAAATGTLEATVSQSLRLLRASEVVAARRDGRLMYYRLADAHVRMLLDLTREHITHEHDQTAELAPPSAAVSAGGMDMPPGIDRGTPRSGADDPVVTPAPTDASAAADPVAHGSGAPVAQIAQKRQR